MAAIMTAHAPEMSAPMPLPLSLPLQLPQAYTSTAQGSFFDPTMQMYLAGQQQQQAAVVSPQQQQQPPFVIMYTQQGQPVIVPMNAQGGAMPPMAGGAMPPMASSHMPVGTGGYPTASSVSPQFPMQGYTGSPLPSSQMAMHPGAQTQQSGWTHPNSTAPPAPCKSVKRCAACKTAKRCAACYTTQTPTWRDSADGTPLCNACGTRWKKYHVRCMGCHYCPRKNEVTTRERCPRCFLAWTDVQNSPPAPQAIEQRRK